MKILLCPDCKEYLGMHYKYCIYCGAYIKDRDLIVEEINTLYAEPQELKERINYEKACSSKED